jgi:hypothetical protein
MSVVQVRRTARRTRRRRQVQLIVIGVDLAQAGQHGLQPGRFGHRNAADVEEVHGPRDALQPRVRIQPEAGRQHLEADARADVREARAVVVEAQCAARRGGRSSRIGQPDEARLGIDEAADQPGAGQAVDPGPRPRGPALALELARSRRAMPCGACATGSPREKRASSAWRSVSSSACACSAAAPG